MQYNYDMGVKTRGQGPGQSQGIIQQSVYDSAGRVQQATTVNNGAYTRYVYGPNYVQTFSTIRDLNTEAYSYTQFNGHGQPYANAADHPGSVGLYRSQFTVYDFVGRLAGQTNPTEMTDGWVPSGDDAAGWLFSWQAHDWKGRSTLTTNTDTTTRTASYGGCGCAGGEVVTLTDEVGRKQKVYSDVLGRTAKSEIYHSDGTTVYATTVNTYNVRDQVTQVRQYQGLDSSGTYQDTTMTFDGFGRLQTKHVPEQQAIPNSSYTSDHATWDYFADDTIQKVTDARGTSAVFAFNGRHLVTSISYTVPSGSGIPPTAPVSYSYDAAGNRISMTDGMGTASYQYDQLSRMTSETRYFGAPLYRTYNLTYGYNLSNTLTSVALPDWSQQVDYNYDNVGRLNAVTASGYAHTSYQGNYPTWYPVTTQITSFASNITYRASGAVRQLTYGNGAQLSMSYNARQAATRFEISNLNYGNGSTYSVGKTYDYYDDGRVRFVGDLFDNRFLRL